MKKFLLSVLIMFSVFLFVSCDDPDDDPDDEQETETVETGVNNDYTLLLQSSEMDGIFNPFFYSSAYDGDVIGLVNCSLLTLDPLGAVVAGDEYSTVALDYSIFYTDNLQTYAPKEDFDEGDYVVYEMVLKNDAQFSDGTEITADDVLFNYYVYLDPSYQGSSTLYTLPILGLTDYRTQVMNSAVYRPIAQAIFEDDLRDQEYVATDDYSEEQFNNYWEAFYDAGAAFSQEIVNYILANYISYVEAIFGEDGPTENEVKNSPTLSMAFGMALWGFGEVSEDGLKLIGASEEEYLIDELTASDFFNEMLLAYEGDPYQDIVDVEGVGSSFIDNATELFIASYADVGSVPNIAGLVKGTKTVDGDEHDTVKILLTQQNPKAILSLGVTVAPKHYYTSGYDYDTEAITNYGVEFDSQDFMDHLRSFNSAPMGAGPYKFVSRDSGDGTVYLERNDKFEKMGGENVHNANIKNVAFKIVTGGDEYDAVDGESVHYATVSATSDVMDSIAGKEKLTSILVDNLGYGYICVNPQIYNNIYERMALTTVFDMEVVKEYYPSGLADIIYRSQSQVSWAYPEGAEAIYPFDPSLETTIEYLKEAGYTFDEETGEFTDVPEDRFEFFLPSEAAAHPAGSIFLKAVDLLGELGIEAKISVDANLIASIKAGPVGVYALAWQSSADPDMYQVYHYNSQAESVISNGIKWLYENGDDNDLGTIEVTKLDGTKVDMNQKEALKYLGDLIEEGTKYMLAEERKPIYEKALEILAQLNIEVPTYQRKNLFVYNSDVIDGTSLSTTVTPYWGPLAEIWKVRFVEGTPGNETIEVPVED